MAAGSEQRGGGRLTEASIEAVRQRADIVDLISGFTQLRRNGAEFTGRCPFHEERTPSFSVNPAKGLYYCFGCRASGDIIKFVREKKGLDFIEAVEELADRYRVPLEYEEGGDAAASAARRANRKRLYEVLESAAAFYERYLWQAKEAGPAREYLRARGVSDETARAFRMGYSPESPDGLSKRARANGFTASELSDAKLTGGKGGDFFRGRLMVPIIDRSGRVIAFGARKLRDEQWGGKYVNSAEGPLFHKSRTLYTAPGARDAAATAGSVVLVEGYMDVIAMHQAGMRNTCAAMGVALTEEQVIELKRLAPRAYFAFDPDDAGQMATSRALEMARAHELDVSVVLLPDGDPADVLAEPDGTERMHELIDNAVSLVHYQVSTVLGSADLATDAGREQVWRRGLELFRTLPYSPEKQAQIDRFVFALGLDQDAAAELRRQAGDAAGPSSAGAPVARSGFVPPGRSAAGPGGATPGAPASATAPGRAPATAARAASPHDNASVRVEKLFLAVSLWLAERGEVKPQASPVTEDHFLIALHRRLWSALRSTSDTPIDISRLRSDTDLVGLVAELTALGEREHLATEGDHAATVLRELEDRLLVRHLERRISTLKEEIRRADDATEEGQLMAELSALEAERRRLDPRMQDSPA